MHLFSDYIIGIIVDYDDEFTSHPWSIINLEQDIGAYH